MPAVVTAPSPRGGPSCHPDALPSPCPRLPRGPAVSGVAPQPSLGGTEVGQRRGCTWGLGPPVATAQGVPRRSPPLSLRLRPLVWCRRGPSGGEGAAQLDAVHPRCTLHRGHCPLGRGCWASPSLSFHPRTHPQPHPQPLFQTQRLALALARVPCSSRERSVRATGPSSGAPLAALRRGGFLGALVGQPRGVPLGSGLLVCHARQAPRLRQQGRAPPPGIGTRSPLTAGAAQPCTHPRTRTCASGCSRVLPLPGGHASTEGPNA